MTIYNLPDDLTTGHCVPCEGGTAPLTKDESTALLVKIPKWNLSIDSHSINREFKFADFKTALEFVNKVGIAAEIEGHHPDIELGWGRVHITLSTHTIGGLSVNDFILAAKIDKI